MTKFIFYPLAVYKATVVWDGQLLTIPIDEVDSEGLVGMSLMEGYELNIQVIDGGMVRLMKPMLDIVTQMFIF